MKIGLLDSGIGGLTVLKACMEFLPNHEYLYYADSLNAPYGTKTKEEVFTLTKNAVDFLIKEGAEIIVLACNSATSVAAKTLREMYELPIIGMEPAIKPAIDSGTDKKVLVTATKLTLKEEKFNNLVEQLGAQQKIDTLALTELVTYAETGKFEEADIISYLTEKLAPFNLDEYSHIVLGCTHFPLYKEAFEKVLPSSIEIIDGNHGTMRRVESFITHESEAKDLKLFLSGQPLIEGNLFNLIHHLLA